MSLTTRAKAGLQALIRHFQKFKRGYRRLRRHPHTSFTDNSSDSDSEWSDSGKPCRRSSFYLFITLWLRDLSGNEILLLSRRLIVECEVRLATRQGFAGRAYPIRDIVSHCVAQLSDEELILVQQRITKEWERRENVAHEELVQAQMEDDREAKIASMADEEELEPMGQVDVATLSMADFGPRTAMLEEAMRSVVVDCHQDAN